MNVDQLTNELGAALRQQRVLAREILRLPAEQLLHRPSAGSWNVLEVFEHLNLSSGVYVRGIEHVFARRAAHHPANSVFKPGLLGNWFTNGMKPKASGDIGWKMHTMKMFDPGRQHGASQASIERFIELCDRFLALLEQARTTDLNKLRVMSSLGPVIRFKAGDAFRFPVAHQERHFLQIERLLHS